MAATAAGVGVELRLSFPFPVVSLAELIVPPTPHTIPSRLSLSHYHSRSLRVSQSFDCVLSFFPLHLTTVTLFYLHPRLCRPSFTDSSQLLSAPTLLSCHRGTIPILFTFDPKSNLHPHAAGLLYLQTKRLLISRAARSSTRLIQRRRSLALLNCRPHLID